MALLTEGLFVALRDNPGVAAFVAPVGAEPYRIYPLVVPQRLAAQPQMSAIVYSIASVERAASYCESDRLVRSSVNIDNYSKSYLTVGQLAKAVQTVLLDFRGMLGGLVEVRTAYLTNEFDLLDIEPGLYRVSQSWDIWHVDD